MLLALKELLKEQQKETARLHRKLVLTQEAAKRTLIGHVPSRGISEALRELDEELNHL